MNFFHASAVTRSDAHFIRLDGSGNGLRWIVFGASGEENCDCENFTKSNCPLETAIYKFQHDPNVSPGETTGNVGNGETHDTNFTNEHESKTMHNFRNERLKQPQLIEQVLF